MTPAAAPARLVDTHCHLVADAYDGDRDDVLGRAAESGVRHVIAVGETVSAARRALELGRADPRVSATAGIHPHHATEWDADSADQLRSLAADPVVVALGEMGLDYHYDFSPRPAQLAAFEAQLALAAELRLPAVVHAREADDDVLACLANQPGVIAILHSFSSGMALLRGGLDLGHYVSFSGMVTFKNWSLDDAVRLVPEDRVLAETDGPFLAPVPHRGRRNEPAYVVAVVERLAAVRGTDPARLGAASTANAARIFGSRVHGS